MARRPVTSLRAFIELLRKEGELRVVSERIDPYLEAAQIAVRSVREGGPALLFEQIAGSQIPLAMNLLSSDRRIELALGCAPAELGEKLLHAAEQLMPPTPSRVWKGVRPLASRLMASRVKRASASLRRSDLTLEDLPILQTWPDDAGRFITLPQVVTYDPINGRRNVGMYRMQLFGAMETGMHWQIQKGGGFHYYQAEQQSKPLDVAVAIGTDPAFLLATVAPLPENIDEMAFAGFLRGAPMRVQRAQTLAIDIPSEAEIVLEGRVAPFARRLEGPFGDHFGHYSHAGQFPIFQLTAILARDQPIFAATVVGKPPMEDKWLGDATQHILGPLIRLTHSEVADVWAYYESGFHNLLGIRTAQRYGKEAMKTALSVATDGQLSLTKCAIVVSKDVDNRSFRALISAIDRNFDVRADVMIVPRVPLDTLDFTSYTMNMGAKLMIDATEKLSATASGGTYRSASASELQSRVGANATENIRSLDPSIVGAVQIEGALLVVKLAGEVGEKENAAWHQEYEIVPPLRTPGRQLLERLIHPETIARLPKGVKIVAVVSEDIDLRNDLEVVWGIFTRFDAARDVCFSKAELIGSTPYYDGVMGIDATWKRGYPNPCE